MRYILILFVFVLSFSSVKAQDKYFTRTGHIYFLSHTSVIDIDGNNNQVVSFINIKTGEVVFNLLVKSFEFTLATASEHFNETYMESHKFPKASFTGTIRDFNKIDLSKKTTYNVMVDGKLTIHGVTKQVSEKGILKMENNKLYVKCDFSVNIADYNIKVPKLVEERVAKSVIIKINADYIPFAGK